MGLGWPHLLILGLVVLLLFGKGRISEMMGDFGKGIKSFKKGLSEEPEQPKSQITQGTTIDAKPEVKQDTQN